MVNKNQYRITNNKPLLHKKGKKWIVIGLSTLMLATFGIGLQTPAHANTNSVKANINHQLASAGSVANSAQQQAKPSNAGTQTSASASTGVEPQAKAVAHSLVNGAFSGLNKVNSSANSSANVQTANKQAGSSAVSSSASASTKASSSASQSSASSSSAVNAKPAIHMFGLTRNTPNNPTAIQTGNYRGMSYKYDAGQKLAEFTSGTANADLSNFIGNAPANIKVAQNIKFDDNIDTSKVNNMQQMFSYDNNLKHIDFGKHFNTSSVTDMNGMFSGDSNLQSLDLSDFNTNNVTDTSFMFNHDTALNSLKLSEKFNINKVTNAGYMFASDNSLQELTLPTKFGGNTNPSQAVNMNQMFGRDPSLQHINNLSALNTKQANNTSFMFVADGALQSLDLSNFNTGNVTNMADMFSSDASLQHIAFGNNFNTSKVTNMNNMLSNDTALQSLDLSKFKVNNVTDMSYLLYNDSNLQSVKFGNDFDASRVNNMNNMFKNDPALNSLDLSHFQTSDLTQTQAMFQNDTNLRSIDFGNGFNTKNDVDMSYMFNNDKSLSSLSLPDSFNTSNVTNTGHMFDTDSSLQTLTLGKNFDTSKVSEMAFMFFGDKNLQHININHPFSTSDATDTSYMFAWNKKLATSDLNNIISTFNTKNDTTMSNMFARIGATEIDLPRTFTTSKVTDMSYMFLQSPNLRKIVQPTPFDTHNVTDMSYMFGNTNLPSDNLNKILSSFDTHKVTNMQDMLGGLTVKNITLPNNFDTSDVANMSQMFENDGNLQSLDLGPNFDTKKVQDTSWMFSHDKSLPTLNLGNKFYANSLQNAALMFLSDNSLTNLNLGNHWYAPNLSNAKMMFGSDKSLSDLNLAKANFQTSNKLSDIDCMFNTNGDMKTIELGNGFDTSGCTNAFGLFGEDSKLQHIDFGSKFNTENATNLQQLFQDDPSLTNLVLPSSFDTRKAYNADNTKDMFTRDNGTKGLDSLTIQSPNTKLNTNASLPALYKKDANDNYTATTANNFNSGNLGTFVRPKNIHEKEKDTEYITYVSPQDNNSIKGVTTISGTDGSMYNGPFKVPAGYQLSAGTPQIKLDNSHGINNPYTIDVTSSNTNDKEHISDIPVDSPTVTFKGTFDLHFHDGKNTIKDIYLPYSITTKNNEELKDLLNSTNPSAIVPTDYLNKVINKFSTSNFSYDKNVNATKYDNVMVDPSAKGYIDTGKTTATLNNGQIDLDFSSNTVPEKVHYNYKGKNEGNTTYNGANDEQGSDTNSQGLKPGWHIDTNTKDTSWIYGNESKNSSDTVNVLPNSASADVQYQYNKNTIASDSKDFHGNDSRATDASDTSTNISNKNEAGIPDGYHLANKSTNVPFDNGKHGVAILPNKVSDTINYQYKGKTISTHNFSGNDYRATAAKDNSVDVTSTNDPNIPAGYHLANKDNSFKFDGSKNDDVPLVPNHVSDTIDYQFSGKTLASDKFGGNDDRAQGASDENFDVTSKNAQHLPAGYHLANKDNKFSYDGNTHNVVIEPNKDTDIVDYQLNGKTVANQDFSGNDAHATNAGDNSFDVTAKNDTNIPSGYHLVNKDNQFDYDNQTHDVAIAPNEIKGTATLHLVYKENNGKVDSKRDITININGHVGDKDIVESPLTYYKLNYSLPNPIKPFVIPMNSSVAPKVANDNYNLSDTFTYVGQTAGDLTVQYVDVDNGAKPIDGEKTDAQGQPIVGNQDLGSLGVAGQTVELGAKGANNGKGVLELLQVPAHWNLVHAINPVTIQLTNAPQHLTLMLMAMPEPSHHTTPAKPNKKPAKPAKKATESTILVNYVDRATGDVIRGGMPMTRKAGTPFDVDDYLDNIPSGYAYDGMHGSVSSFDNDNHIINIMLDKDTAPSSANSQSAPAKPSSASAKPSSAKSASSKAPSASTKPSSASAKPSNASASVKPSSNAQPSNSGSATSASSQSSSAQPSSVPSSVTPTSATNSNEPSQSTSSVAPKSSAEPKSNNSTEPVSQSTAKPSTSSASGKVSGNNSLAKSASSEASVAKQNSSEPSVEAKNQLNNAKATKAVAQNSSNHESVKHPAPIYANGKKLPQTGEANAHMTLFGAIMLAIAGFVLGIGKRTDKKHNE